MTLSFELTAISVLPSVLFAVLLAVLLRPRSLAMSVLIFAVGGLLSFVAAMMTMRIVSRPFETDADIEGESSVLTAATDAFFDAALPEELARFAVLVAACVCLKRFRNPTDLVLWGALIAFGFSAIENAMYSLTSGGAIDSLMRLIPTLSHGSDGIIMGALLTLAAVTRRGRWLFVGLALFIPVLLHFLFDFGQFATIALGPRIDGMDLEGDPTAMEVSLLAAALILMSLPIIVWIGEIVAAVLIVRRIRRRTRPAVLVSEQPLPA